MKALGLLGVNFDRVISLLSTDIQGIWFCHLIAWLTDWIIDWLFIDS